MFTPFNYAKGRQYGVEFTTSLNRENFSAYTNFAYAVAQGNQVVSDQFLFGADELAFIREHYIFLDHDQTFTESAGIAYNLYGFLLSLSQIYGSGLRSGFANTGNLPTYFQFNFGLTKLLTVFKDDDFQARFDIINMFDHSILIRDGSGIGVGAAQYGPRLTFYGGLKWNFNFGQTAQPTVH